MSTPQNRAALAARILKQVWEKDRANIDDGELLAFPKLADLYRGKAKADLEAELEIGALLEIDHGN